MQLIIVQGSPGTGKTTLAVRLATDLGYTLFMRDAYKEERYDKSTKKPSLVQLAKIETDSWQTLYAAIREAITSNKSLVVEGNFKAKQRQAIKKLLHPGVRVVEIYCYAKGLLPFRRYVRRWRSGKRHPVHLDHLWYAQVLVETLISLMGLEVYKPLRLSADVLVVDTTDVEHLNYGRILNYVSKAREKGA